MKRSTNSTCAAAILIALAMTGQVAAAPPSDTADMDNTTPYEEQQEEQAGEDETNVTLSEEAQQEQTVEKESQTLAVNTAEDAPSDNGSGAGTTEKDGTSTAQTSKPSESKPSESRTLKSELKHALLGLLLPAVERRVRKAVGSDDDTSDPQSNP
jgi:hypothetical protein